MRYVRVVEWMREVGVVGRMHLVEVVGLVR